MTVRRPAVELTLSQEGMDVLFDREGLELEAYLDDRGILTIGVGHTSAAGPPKVEQGMKITRDEAQKIFRQDAQRFRSECRKTMHIPLHQHEFDAMASFLFNVGSTNFLGSTALKRLNQGDYAGCADAMAWWDKPPSIISRRKGEIEQFLHGRYEARVL
jgi:lysozyme